jgi:glycosyltransferase involved in cell wall biosynthesis
MRIGIMLRHYDQHGGGVRVYTQNLLHELAKLDTEHEFVLVYRNPDHLGSHGNGTGLREVSRQPLGKWRPKGLLLRRVDDFLWDQLAMPKVARDEGFDLIFNPKYSVAMRAKCPAVFVCHGLDLYVRPSGARWFDRMNYYRLMPKYAKRAGAIIAVSEVTREHAIRYLRVPEEKVHTVYLGVAEAFQRPVTQAQCDDAKARYGLPDRYFLFVGQIYPPKNFGRLVQAYAKIGPERGIALVVAGGHTKTKLCSAEIALIDELGLSDWVVKTGWVEHDQLPPIYAQAESLVMPSLYEACPSPPLEAMSVNCPVVAADRYGTKDVSGDAAVLVDPEDVDSIAEGMRRIVEEPGLKQRLITAGRARASQFTWQRCARQTIGVLESVAG